jgi:hypothetical protein
MICDELVYPSLTSKVDIWDGLASYNEAHNALGCTLFWWGLWFFLLLWVLKEKV